MEVEALSLLHRRYGMQACRFVQEEVLSLLAPIWVTPILHARGLARFLQSGRSLALVDAVSFEVMMDADVTHAFAFDDDFRRAGFQLVTD